MSRTSDAMNWVFQDPEHRSYYAAAKRFRVNQSALTQAKKAIKMRALEANRGEDGLVCPHCCRWIMSGSTPVGSKT